ncbi:tRNA epoxyqueuosine(34) reductase QueG [Pontibacterium granulatum]|uniref:tRNA epoxyqueuosine(34) reductase QueG n=1 Tax=Pontibacterium granulatum TaxID=2036029 RepID=UPI00249CD87A|nr:tRNA epoxyqueuosine(34) reductase QueG [Pontibacterium granulatum]MDI3323698.1 tRNA epoxyqueuosine(34) reductase QueG [Pontibacterium granulatum]
MRSPTPEQLDQLTQDIKTWARELGFQQCGITTPDLSEHGDHLKAWLDAGYQGQMDYLNNHFEKRLDPTLLVPGTQRIICVRMDYMPENTRKLETLSNSNKGYVARYTLGRDYHKLMRKRLTQLGKKIAEQVDELGYRAFVDSAPVLERPLAQKAGIGWIGKHGLVLNREAGSWFLLGELFIDLALPIDPPETENHCGRCSACIDVCPTEAFPQPGVLDGSRCISYLTIELKGNIPEELRSKMGNRIFGCDDCQLICPWNSFSHYTQEADFYPRNDLGDADLLELFSWDEETFLKRTEGSAIRRTGHEGWLRNIAVALGNGLGGEAVISALNATLDHPSAVVQEHVRWALDRLQQGNPPQPLPILSHPGVRRVKD